MKILCCHGSYTKKVLQERKSDQLHRCLQEVRWEKWLLHWSGEWSLAAWQGSPSEVVESSSTGENEVRVDGEEAETMMQDFIQDQMKAYGTSADYHVVLFSLIPLHVHLSFPQATPGMRLEMEPPNLVHPVGLLQPHEQPWWVRPAPLTQLQPSLPGLSSSGLPSVSQCHARPECPRELLVKVFLIIYSIATERRLRKYGYNVPHPSLWRLTDSNPIFSLVPHKRWLRESI